MDAVKEAKEFLDRADKMLDRLTKALVDEKDDKATVPLMVYVAAKFTAGLLLGIQEEVQDIDLADEYTKSVKELMASMREDVRVQSIKNKVEKNKRAIEEAKYSGDEVVN
jgi:hypothetical protein